MFNKIKGRVWAYCEGAIRKTGNINQLILLSKTPLLKEFSGAPRETRTPDPLITNQVLYQLSYKGITGVELA